MATTIPPAGPRSSTASSTSQGETSRSLGHLVSDATRDLSALVKNEIALAKIELRDDAKAAAKGGAMFGAAAALGLLALILLSFAAVYGLVALGLAQGWSFLIVAAVFLLVAGILALIGKKALTRIRPPERTITTTKETITVLRAPSSGA